MSESKLMGSLPILVSHSPASVAYSVLQSQAAIVMMKQVVFGLIFAITDDASCKHTKKASKKLKAESIPNKKSITKNSLIL